MSTPAARRLAAQVGAIARQRPDDPALPRLRHRLSVERADAALSAIDQRLLTEDERARLRSRLNGINPPDEKVMVRPSRPPVTPSVSAVHAPSPA